MAIRNRKQRLDDVFKMSTIDVVVAMSDGLVGVIVICSELVNNEPKVDPDSFWGNIGIGSLITLDYLGIYGERIGRLWKLCQCDPVKMIAVLRANQLGLEGADERTLNYAIDDFGGEINVDAVMKAVKDRLPNFNPEAVVPPANTASMSWRARLKNLWKELVHMAGC